MLGREWESVDSCCRCPEEEGETWTEWRRQMAKCVLHMEVTGLADRCNEGMQDKEIQNDEHVSSLK